MCEMLVSAKGEKQSRERHQEFRKAGVFVNRMARRGLTAHSSKRAGPGRR